MQSKRQGTTFMVIPCLYSFLLTVLRTLAAEPPINKKRTRTLSRKESGCDLLHVKQMLYQLS